MFTFSSPTVGQLTLSIGGEAQVAENRRTPLERRRLNPSPITLYRALDQPPPLTFGPRSVVQLATIYLLRACNSIEAMLRLVLTRDLAPANGSTAANGVEVA